ncbi:hypothetical protein D3C83_162230 [compost metagenome]
MQQQQATTPLPWWSKCKPVGFTAEAWKRVAQGMGNTREARSVAAVQGLQEAKLLGKARSAMRIDS